MGNYLVRLAGLICLSGSGLAMLLAASNAQAATSGAIYNMQRMLSEPHPFANPPPLSPPPAAAPIAPRVAPRVAPQGDQSSALWDVVSEVRGSLLAHDQGPFSSNKEDGVDINLEAIFVSPDILDVMGAPRPHFGLTANSSGDTSQVYAGLGWEWDFWRSWFAGFSVGGAIHDGKNTTSALDRKELGCRVLFRESIDLGYRISKRHSVMGHLSHISNAKLCSENEGLETAGIRYGHRF